MKVINTGSKYDIYPDNLKSFDLIPAGFYTIGFNLNVGFWLERYYDFKIFDSKIYGVHLKKVSKVLKSFELFNRNLGVILSGDKGIGKSLFARLLGKETVNNGMPVIIVDSFIPGIGGFIDKIDQEVMVLFDEFDKTFNRGKNDAKDPQAGLLSLFDGVSQGKKLFVITCNELYGLNNFLVNRPGRFHYHFRFHYPTAEDIREYLMDKLDEAYRGEIERVINFSKRVALNYDCLRAIAFELNLGITFSEAIGDLNIINVRDESYKIVLQFDDGTTITNKRYEMDLFDSEDMTISMYDKQGRQMAEITISPDDIKYNPQTGYLCVEPENIRIDYDYYYYCSNDEDEEKRKLTELEAREIKLLTISRIPENLIHYAV